MMNLGQMGNLLIKHTKQFRNSPAGTALVAGLANRVIDEHLAVDLITPLITLCEEDSDKETAQHLTNHLQDWAPRALDGIRRNYHMNNANGCGTLNQDTADALIVEFANSACYVGAHLGLYAKDLAES